MLQDDTTVRNADAMALAEDAERDIRVAIWNAAMNGGMGQDLSQAFIRRAMDEPTMKRALATLESSPADGATGVEVPLAYLHTLHMEGEQTYTRLSEDDGTDPDEPSRTGFGIPGRDYSAEYPVTTTPLYARSLTPTETGEQGK